MGDRTRLLIDIGTGDPVIADTWRRGLWHAGERIGFRVPEQAITPMPKNQSHGQSQHLEVRA